MPSRVGFLSVLVLGLAAGVACLENPSYTALGFHCATDSDCDAQTQCLLAQCRPRSAGDSGIPDSTTTGVPAGVVLTPVGDVEMREDGGVLDARNVTGCIDVYANGVTIMRSKILCSGSQGVDIHDGVVGTVVEDVEIDGAGNESSDGVVGADFTALRVNAHGVSTGFKIGNHVLVQDCYAHDLSRAGLDTNGSNGLTLLHSNFDASPDGNNAVFGSTYNYDVTNWLLQANRFVGGGWTVQIGGDGGSSVRILGNRFGHHAAYGPMALEPGMVEHDNVWDDAPGTNVDADDP